MAVTQPAKRRQRPHGMTAAWIVITLTMATSSIIALTVLPGYNAAHPGVSLPWWFLIVAFAASESWVVHLYFRREAGSFSTVEIPIVLGALFAPPLLVWLTVAVGVGLALTIVRRQLLVKVLFNIANLTLHAAVVAIVFNQFRQDDVLAPGAWYLVFGATILGGALQMLNLATVITLAEGGVGRTRILSMIGTGVIVSAVNTALALVTALVMVYEPLGVLLLSAHAATLLIAYRSYANERVRREQIEFLHASTWSIRHGVQASEQVSTLLAKACSMFRAERATLYLHDTVAADDEPGGHGRHHHDEGSDDTQPKGATAFRFVDGTTTVEPADHCIDQLAHLADWSSSNRLISPPTGDEHLDALLAGDVTEQAMVGVLRGTNRAIGALVVADRLGQIVGFDDQDLSLFAVLTEQASAALENDHLERVLDQMRRLERRLAHQATHDALTGLANRAYFLETLDRMLPSERPIGLLYIDLDDFKSANDRWGHSTGDAVLVEVAARLTNEVRPGDLVARLGGDEFAILLVSGDAQFEAVGRRIVESLSRPILVGDAKIVVGASVGVAGGSHPWTDPESLLDAADRAMYTAKRHGKGTVATYDPATEAEPAEGPG